MSQQQSWGPSYSDQGLDSGLAYIIHKVQHLLTKTTQLTQLINQLLDHLEKVENRMSALEEALAEGNPNSMKKCGGGLKAGSNSHPLLKVSRRWRLCTSL